MGISVVEAEGDHRTEWNDCVPPASASTFFHQLEVLELLAEYSDATLRLLMGYKGQELIGVLPLFESDEGRFRELRTAPRGFGADYAGPALFTNDQLKQVKRERRNRRFVEAAIEYAREEYDPDHFFIRTSTNYDDVRPFQWNDFRVSPSYTYVIDLGPGAESVLMSFSRGRRRNVRNTDEDRYAIREGDRDCVRKIVDQLVTQYPDSEYVPPPEFALDLYDMDVTGCLRPYVCQVDGEYAGGILAIEGTDAVHFWQGAATPSVDVPVNDLLHWRIITDAIERDLDRYHIMDATDPSVNEYKSQFGPEPVPLFCLQWDSRRKKTVERASGVFRGISGLL